MPHAITLNMNITITQDEFKELVKKWSLTRRDQSSIGAITAALDPELREFDRYLESQKMDPMGNIERQIVREFLGWLLCRE
jgi:hypothetical protein